MTFTHLVTLLLPALAAFVLSYALTPITARVAAAIGAIDMPGERKIHTTPVPRLGGLAVVVSIAIVLVALPSVWSTWQPLPSGLSLGLFLGALPILIVSLIDDVRSVNAHRKVLAHLSGGVIAVSFGISLGPVVHLFGAPIYIGVLATPLSVLWIVGVTNAFNIIDGLDGLSAGLALISASAMAAVFMLVSETQMGVLALVLAGALAGFLPFNAHPARLFLGDTGATAVGFCLAAFALKGGSTLSAGFAALLPVFILGLPIADALSTVARRTIHSLETRSGGVFEPDRNHIHHRLIAIGVDHRRAVLVLYCAGFLLAIVGLISIVLTAREAGLLMVAVLLAGLLGMQRLGYDEFAVLRRGTVLKMYEVPAVKRGMFVVFVDIFVTAIASYLAIGLKTDQWTITAVHRPVLALATTLAPVTVAVFWVSGMYRGSWRLATIQDLTRCVNAVAGVTGIGFVLVPLLARGEHSVSLVTIYGVIHLLLTASLRASYVVLEGTKLRASHQGRPVVIYGAGRRGAAAARELFQNSAAGLRPIGFIDDDITKRGKLVGGLSVFGTQRELRTIIKNHGAEAVLLATHKIPRDVVEDISVECKHLGARMFRLEIRVEHLSDAHELDPAPMSAPLASHATSDASSTLPIWVAEPCPSCGKRDVHRSKARNAYERIRKTHTAKRLFRCHKCGWRGWLIPLDLGLGRGDYEMIDLDLSPIDGALERPFSPIAPMMNRGQ